MDDFRKMICLDFDGVIHSYTSGWRGAAVIPDPPVPGALTFIHDTIMYSDYGIQIMSARAEDDNSAIAIREYLFNNMCEYLGTTSEMSENIVDQIEISNIKSPRAILFIDDRGFCFRGTFPSMLEIINFQPWYK